MRVPWKLLGLAGVAGVAATGAVVVRRRRAQRAYDPAELRERLHRRLAEVAAGAPATSEPPADRPPGGGFSAWRRGDPWRPPVRRPRRRNPSCPCATRPSACDA